MPLGNSYPALHADQAGRLNEAPQRFMIYLGEERRPPPAAPGRFALVVEYLLNGVRVPYGDPLRPFATSCTAVL
jgi:hypothetical protein